MTSKESKREGAIEWKKKIRSTRLNDERHERSERVNVTETGMPSGTYSVTALAISTADTATSAHLFGTSCRAIWSTKMTFERGKRDHGEHSSRRFGIIVPTRHGMYLPRVAKYAICGQSASIA